MMKKTQSIPSRRCGHNATCVGTLSLATLAGASSLQAAPAQSGIVTNTDLGLSGFTIGNGDGSTSVAWNIDGAGGVELDAVSSTSYGNAGFTYFRNNFELQSDGFQTASLLNLGYSAPVGIVEKFVGSLSRIMSYGSIALAEGFTSGVSGYMGFRFNPNGTTLYGWAEIILTEGGSTGSIEVVRWAYDADGVHINTGETGVVPEPAGAAFGLGALALGAAGLRRMRRTKAA